MVVEYLPLEGEHHTTVSKLESELGRCMMTIKTKAEQRRLFWTRHVAGETYEKIAQAFGLSKECVRYWCRRQRDGQSVRTKYRRVGGGLLSSFDRQVPYVLLRLRLAHPRWGPGTLLYHMSLRRSLKGVPLPSKTQIGRYLRQWRRFRRLPRKPKVKRQRPEPARRVHQRWQVDFKMAIALQDGSQFNLHTVRDEVGAACVGGDVTPAGKRGKPARRVTREELQATLRSAFQRWGTLPEEVQTDGEPLFVGQPVDTFPSKFTLWLTGLGIDHRVIRPGKPTDNAQVERANRTLNEYAIVGNEHLSLAQLQPQVAKALEELAFELPSRARGCAGKPPATAHPQLLARPRPFSLELEWARFDLRLVDTFLAQFLWRRKVGKTGQITLGGHRQRYSLGRAFARQHVLIRFDSTDRHFVFFAEDDPLTELGRRPARNLELEDITGLSPTNDNFIPQQLPLPFLTG